MLSERTRNPHLGIIAGLALAVMLFLGILTGPSAAADGKPDQEYQVKAAFIYNFAKFVEWPSSSFKDPQSPLTICILGNDPIKTALDDLKGKRAGERPVTIKRVSTVDQTEGCHILFITASEKGNLPSIVKSAAKLSTLTVGDTKSFANEGVMINLILIDNKIGFEINPSAAEQASLKVSSKLLKLGRIIK